MKINEILTEAKIGFDPERKHIEGPVKEWLKAIGADADDVREAFYKAKALTSYKDVVNNLSFELIGGPNAVRNGTFTFKNNDKAANAEQYLVYANGQIRYHSGSSWMAHDKSRNFGKLKSVKPALVAGDPVASLVKMYDNAFKELLKKYKKD